MPHPLVVKLAPALLLAATPAAPVPKEKPDGSPYFPTKVGARWVYRTRHADQIDVVTAVERKGGAAVVTVGWEENGGQVRQLWKASVSEAGLFRVPPDSVTPPECLLALPVKPGRTWEGTGQPSRTKGPTKATLEVRHVEEVEVPAGKYRAVCVEKRYIRDGTPEVVTYWYAPGVGMVKMAYRVAGWQFVIMTLKEFTPGKD